MSTDGSGIPRFWAWIQRTAGTGKIEIHKPFASNNFAKIKTLKLKNRIFALWKQIDRKK